MAEQINEINNPKHYSARINSIFKCKGKHRPGFNEQKSSYAAALSSYEFLLLVHVAIIATV